MNDNTYKNTLYLLIENKFGALERVIGTFTLRGYKIDNLYYSKNRDANLYDLKLTMDCTDQDLEKLVKILHNQIHVIEIKLMLNENETDQSRIPLAS
jgi:acetolactate synthase-1/3 small subunit